MMQLLQYTFFQNALLAILLIGIAGGILGPYIVTRRLVSISGGITHACFGGLGLGYFLGMPPIWFAAAAATASAIGIQTLSANGRVREDSAIAMVWALGMALGVTFVFLTPGAVPELNSFLFGNILTVSPRSLYALAAFAVILTIFVSTSFQRITACAFDPDFAQVIGLKVHLYNGAMLLLVAIGIVLMIQCTGMMLLMSMLTLPAMTAELFRQSLKQIIILSVIISVAGGIAGLFLASAINIPASAMIVAAQVAIYTVCKLFRR